MKKSVETGVADYVCGKATVTVYFPVDFKGEAHLNCYQCRFFQRTSGRCSLTGEISEFPQKYIGGRCPLNFEED